jgi:hypothetical protein
MRFQVDAGLLGCADFQARFIMRSVQPRLATQTGRGAGGTDKLQNGLVTHQRLSGPIPTNEAEQTMLDPIPLRRTRGKGRHSDCQLTFIGQVLQAGFPQPAARIIRAAIVRLNEQVLLAAIGPTAHLQPPRTNRGDGKFSRLMRDANDQVASVAANIVDAIQQREALRVTAKVRLQHIDGPPPPSAPDILEIADQLALLGIDGNGWFSSFLKGSPLAREVPHLTIAVRILRARQPLAIGAQGIPLIFQQAAQRVAPYAQALSQQLPTQLPQRLPRPLDAGDRMTRGVVFQQPVQHRQHARLFFSTGGRPAPGRRIRSIRSARPGCWSSWRPRTMVLRLRPVISIRRWTPPRPHCKASKPTKRRRFLSSKVANARLSARCCSAVVL